MNTFDSAKFARLFSALLETLGLPAEAPQDGRAALRIGDRLVHLDWTETRGSILIWACVAELDRAEPSPEDLRRALEAGFLLAFEQGASLSYNRASRTFVLAQPVGPAALTPKDLEAHLAAFTAAFDLARARLSRAAPPADDRAEATQPGFDTMIRI